MRWFGHLTGEIILAGLAQCAPSDLKEVTVVRGV